MSYQLISQEQLDQMTKIAPEKQCGYLYMEMDDAEDGDIRTCIGQLSMRGLASLLGEIAMQMTRSSFKAGYQKALSQKEEGPAHE